MKKFYMNGVIVNKDDKWIYDFFGITSVTPEEVIAFLDDANGEEIKVYVDSPGGEVSSGSDIYSALREYAGKSIAYVTGWAASAAAWAILGADTVIASPTARFMYHNAQSYAEGDYRDMEAAAGRLKNANKSFLNAFQIKTGKSINDLQALLDKDTFYDAQQAYDNGFIDEIALKEGEELEPLIAAAMPMGGINIQKMHDLAMKYKNNHEQLMEEAKPEDKSGGENRPVLSDTLKTQRQEFNKLRKKIFNRG